MFYIWKEWKENIRGKGLWFFLSIIILVSVSILVQSSELSIEQGFYILLINLYDLLLYFIPILCLFLGAFSIFQEKEQKTFVMLISKQDSTGSFLLKKSIAIQSVLLGVVLIWFMLYLAPIKFMFSLDFGKYLVFLTVILSMTFIFTQIGIAIGSFSRSRMQIVGIAIFVWFYFFFMHDFMLLSFLPDVTYDNVKLFSFVFFLNPIQTGRIFLETGLEVNSFDHMSKLLQSFMWTKPGVFMLANWLLLSLVSFFTALGLNRKEAAE
ncbi:ABC transporter permease [Bacillus benzoevorans]|uniref:ABC-2 type transport system permease protein n=1 Tax=Bacillus benzoevorans TaxID=1456 RepID=A0A7X0HRJ6_9BACI|nr:ABC transporter permease subunit [Bacillus benzoevorans]MBB6445509.1 ABC-2 type transport system permease protein [Bacillus benzoevorans]